MNRSTSSFLWVVLILIGLPAVAHAQGIVFPWAGPVNRSMGGAGTAAPTDAITATYWNPAAMSDMRRSELAAAVELIFPEIETASSVLGGAFSGSTEGNPGVTAMPYLGWVYKTRDPRLTVGFSLAPIGGAKTNYPSSATNPYFLPQPNTVGSVGGIGQLYTEAQFLQMAPSISYRLNERFSIGLAPTLVLGQVIADPYLFAAPDDADGTRLPRFASGRGSEFHYGGGFQFSAFYKLTPRWTWGASLRTRQDMETFRATGTDELGLPRSDLTIELDVPLTLSVGTAWQERPDRLWAADFRFINNESTRGWGTSGFNPDGSLAGLGYRDAFAAMFGVQQHLNPHWTVRAGYTYSTNPLDDSNATNAVAAPLYYQHVLSSGATYRLTCNSSIDLAYSYLFENELSGPIVSPAGVDPSSNITTTLSAHAATLGFRVKY